MSIKRRDSVISSSKTSQFLRLISKVLSSWNFTHVNRTTKTFVKNTHMRRLHFDTSCKQHLHHQSNKNRYKIFECMVRSRLLMHQTIAALLRFKTKSNVVFLQTKSCKIITLIWAVELKKFREGYARFSLNKKLF